MSDETREMNKMNKLLVWELSRWERDSKTTHLYGYQHVGLAVFVCLFICCNVYLILLSLVRLPVLLRFVTRSGTLVWRSVIKALRVVDRSLEPYKRRRQAAGDTAEAQKQIFCHPQMFLYIV